MKTLRHISIVLVIVFSHQVAFAQSQDLKFSEDYQLALDLFFTGAYTDAINLLEQLIEKKPEGDTLKDYSKPSWHWRVYGKGLKKELVYPTIDYRPHEYLASAKKLVQNEQRRENPPQLELHWLSLNEPSKDNVLDGGEKASIVFSIENVGNTLAEDVRLHLQIDDPKQLQFKPMLEVGSIAPQQTVTVSTPIVGDRSLLAKQRQMLVTAHEAFGFDSNSLSVVLHTRPYQPPKLKISDLVIVDTDGNGLISPQEMITVSATVTNIGKGIAENITARVKTGEFVFLGASEQKTTHFSQLIPDQSSKLQFTFFTTRRLKHGTRIPLQIELTDAARNYSESEELQLFLTNGEQQTFDPYRASRSMVAETDKVLYRQQNTPQQSAQTQRKHAVAVIIGNRNYQIAGVPNVDYAQNDGYAIKQWLIKKMGYLEGNILDMRDATAARFNETFGSNTNHKGRLFQLIKPGISEVFVYYSGHGAPGLIDEGSYFVPVDVNPNFITTSGYNLDTLYNNLAKLDASHITVVLDTCFSGNTPKGFLLQNVSPAFVSVKTDQPESDKMTIYTSAASTQVSSWYNEKNHSLFTYFFLLGANGKADANIDGHISVEEMSNYLATEVPYHAMRINGVVQTPEVIGNRGHALFSNNSKAQFAAK